MPEMFEYSRMQLNIIIDRNTVDMVVNTGGCLEVMLRQSHSLLSYFPGDHLKVKLLITTRSISISWLDNDF